MTTAGWVMAIVWTAIIVALVAGAIYWLVSASARREESWGESGVSARAILDRRLASGEISVQEYGELRAALEREAGAERREGPAGGGGAAVPAG